MPKILSSRQVAILEFIGKEKNLVQNFYLSGGTPLAAFYLHHRYSEDLDFFSEQEIDMLALGAQFMKAKEAADMPRMITEIPAKEWQDFFEEEAKKLGKEILA